MAAKAKYADDSVLRLAHQRIRAGNAAEVVNSDPAFTARYWGRTYETDWKKGSGYAVTEHGVRVEDPAQLIVESDPPRRLSYTWNTFNAELAEALGWDDELFARMAAGRRSTVTFEIAPDGDDSVRLTVIHDGFDEGSAMLESISGGWPRVLANLKTMLETGEAESLWISR